MRLPSSLPKSRLIPDGDSWRQSPRPLPLGFAPFPDYAFGDGDSFGLYWPIGLEHKDPLVAESYHDDGSLIPAFSSWETFLEVMGAEGVEEVEGDVVESPSLAQDPASPLACFRAARQHLTTREFATATALLEKAVDVLPEYTEALELLVAQYRREREIESGIRVALRALRSPPCFGKTPVQALRWLAGQNACPSDLENDPLWRHRRDLRFRFGGEKINDDYRILERAVQEYLEAGKTIEGICLLQTFGELIYRETTSFCERYGFHPKRHMDYLREVSENAGHPRTAARLIREV